MKGLQQSSLTRKVRPIGASAIATRVHQAREQSCLADTPRHNDQPITQPSEDLYVFDPFTKAIADDIRNMPAPNGCVPEIEGPSSYG